MKRCFKCSRFRAGVLVYDRERYQSNTKRRRAAMERLRFRRTRNPERNRAYCLVHKAVKSGKLTRQPCEICGQKAQAHHHDYSKPLDVQWLCMKHHREIKHSKAKQAVEWMRFCFSVLGWPLALLAECNRISESTAWRVVSEKRFSANNLKVCTNERLYTLKRI